MPFAGIWFPYAEQRPFWELLAVGPGTEQTRSVFCPHQFVIMLEEYVMKMTLALTAGILAAGIYASTGGIASAQSDRTLGINCTVAGHIRCGENGGYRWRHRHWHHYAAYAYARDCRVVRQRVETSSGRVIYRSRQICD